MNIRTEPATPDRWSDVVSVFTGRRGRDACWCQRFCRHDAADNQAALERELEVSLTPIGLLAYVDDDPAGWSRVVPRHSLPGVTGNAALRRLSELSDDDSAWWISCFATRRSYRGQGVGVALLHAAVDFAREHKATVLDGHPVDVDALTGSPSPSALFTGTKAMFVAAGFEEIGRTYPSRPVMRKTLT